MARQVKITPKQIQDNTGLSHVSKLRKDPHVGHFIARRSYYYRMGMTAEKWSE